jgi:hypothetical protein
MAVWNLEPRTSNVDVCGVVLRLGPGVGYLGFIILLRIGGAGPAVGRDAPGTLTVQWWRGSGTPGFDGVLWAWLIAYPIIRGGLECPGLLFLDKVDGTVSSASFVSFTLLNICSLLESEYPRYLD